MNAEHHNETRRRPSLPLALRVVLTWVLLFALAMVNGALRDLVLRPLLGAVALPTASITLMALLAAAIYAFVRRTPLTRRQAWLVGLAWLALTLAAETALTIVSGRPASDVLASFTWPAIAAGNWVVLDFLFVTIAPALFTWLRRGA
jgi:hypothetical protein